MDKIVKTIAEELGIKPSQVENTIKLIDEGNTIPFIARYRKEVTGGLSDEILRNLGERLTYLRNLETRKEEIVKSIEEQGKLTDEILQAVAIAKTLAEVEDIYRPYKQKKKTRATVAKAKGLEPLAEIILEQKEKKDINEIAKEFVNINKLSEEDKKNKDKVVANEEEAIQGALDIIAENVGVDKEEILGFDLSLYNRMRGTVLGADREYFSAPRIDDLQCMYSTLEGFLNSESDDNVTVFAAFDNEEVGSGTKQGAKSSFLRDVLERICNNSETYKRAVAKSFMLSCDNAHAVHPNFADKSDSTNRVYMNGGIVIKYNANQRYTTDAVSEAVVKYVCKNAGVPYQMYANRSDIPGGSTLGNLSNEKVSLNTADIGLAQLAMHSSYETAGSRDTEYMVKMIKEFYKTEIVL